MLGGVAPVVGGVPVVGVVGGAVVSVGGTTVVSVVGMVVVVVVLLVVVVLEVGATAYSLRKNGFHTTLTEGSWKSSSE